MKYIEMAKKNRKRIISSILCAAMLVTGVAFTPAAKIYAEENPSVEVTVEEESSAAEKVTIEELTSENEDTTASEEEVPSERDEAASSEEDGSSESDEAASTEEMVSGSEENVTDETDSADGETEESAAQEEISSEAGDKVEESTTDESTAAEEDITEAEKVTSENEEFVAGMQERIDAIPTVDEFLAMADDNGSSLNEAQVAAYMAAGELYDEYLELDEYIQTLLDMSRVYELLTYLNSQVDTIASKAVTFDYNGYPYGVISDSTITLTVELKSGTAQTIEWYRSDSKDGEYTLIDGANELSYSFTAVTGTAYWYKCSVNGYDTEAVQVIYAAPSASGDNQINVYSQSGNRAWYISNGTMAYTAGTGNSFDVVGTYTYTGNNSGSGASSLVGKTVWISTSYSGGWTTDGIKQMICTFSPDEPHAVLCTALLRDSSTQFGLYADVCLGSSYLFGSLADGASLKAIVKDGRAEQIQMVGAASVDAAKVTDPAFVLQCVDAPTTFYMGYYSNCRGQYYNYNTSLSSSGAKAHENIGGVDVVTEVAETDSGFAMGWTGVSAGGTVRFNFNIGSVEQAGAQIKANSEVTSTTVTVSQEEGEIGTIQFRLYDKTTGEYTDWKIPDNTGKAVFEGLTPNHTYEIQAKKVNDTDDKFESMGDTTTAIDPLKPGSGSTGGEEAPSVESTVSYNSISFKNLSSAYQYRLLDEEDSAATRWTFPSGDDNSIVFEGLYPGEKYYLVAKSSNNSQTEKVEYATLTVVLKYDANAGDEQITVPDDQTFSNGDSLSTDILVREGYEFLGWNPADAKDSTEAMYEAGEHIENDINEPVTLYACWKIKTFTIDIQESEHYTISRSSGTSTAEYGSDYKFVITPVKGYILSNVKVKENGTLLAADSGIIYDADSDTYTCTLSNVTEEKTVTISYDFTSAMAIARVDAKRFLEDKLAGYTEEINNLPNLTDSDKQEFIASLRRCITTNEDLMDSVSAPNATDTIERLKNAAVDGMDGILSDAKSRDLLNAKENAKAEVERAAAEAKAAIDELSDLSSEEAALEKAKVDEQKQSAFTAIDAAEDIEDITDAKNTGIDNISDEKKAAVELDLTNAKDKAKEEIAKKAEEAKKEVDEMTDLTDEERTAAKADIDAKAEEANANIDAITEPSDKNRIEPAKQVGFNEINGSETEAASTDLANAKKKAIAELEKNAEETRKALDTLTDLTDEERQAALEKIDSQLKNAKAGIEAVTNPSEKSNIEPIKLAGSNTISNIKSEAENTDLANAKDKAIAEITENANYMFNIIDSLPDLTESEKQRTISEFNDIFADAMDGVDRISSPSDKADIASVKIDSNKKMNSIRRSAENKDLSNAKEKAVAELEKNMIAAKESVEALTDLTDEEKQAALADIESQFEAAKSAITKVTDPAHKSEVAAAKASGNENIAGVQTKAEHTDLANAKDKAKEEIADKAEAAKKTVDEMTDLTDEEKTAAKADIDKKADEAKANVDAIIEPSDKDGIEPAKQVGFDEISARETEAVNTDLGNAKDKAKEEIADKAEAAKKTVDEMTDLTDEEKTAAKADIEAKAEKAKANVDAITEPSNKAQIEPAKQVGFDEISVRETEAVNTDLTNAKEKAVAELEKNMTAAKETIEALTDLTDEEKQAALADIESQFEAAKSAITEVTDPTDKAEVAAANISGNEKITGVQAKAEHTDLANAKDKAKEEIDDKAEAAKKAVDEMTDLTDEEKTAAKADIEAKAEKAKANVDAITAPSDKAGIEPTKQVGFDEINGSEKEAINTDLTNAKDKAKEEIAGKAEAAKKAVDEMTDLTDEEKAAAKADIDKRADEAKANVDAITEPANKGGIEPAKQVGFDEISGRETEAVNKDFTNAKEKAKEEIDSKAEEAKKLIDSYEYISQAEKEAAKKNIDDKVSAIKNKIDLILEISDKINISDIKLEANTEIESKQIEISEISAKRIEENRKQNESNSSNVKYDDVKETPVKDAANLEYGKGQINVSIESKAENSDRDDKVITGILVSSYENIVNACLGREEQQRVNDGSKIDIRLTVTSLENVPADDKASMESYVEELAEQINGLTIGDYIDLQLEKRIGTEEWKKISETNEDIVITIDIPENLKKQGAVYSIMRCHNGESTLLEDLDDNQDTITIKTGKFSTYAIVYTEQPEVRNEASSLVDTGDSANVVLYAVLLFMSAAAIMCVGFTRKKRV